MSVCGLTCSPSRISCCMVSARKSSSSHGLVSSLTKNWSSGIRMKLSSCIDRNYLTPLIHQHSTKRNHIIRRTIYASFGDMTDDSNDIQPDKPFGEFYEFYILNDKIC